MKDNKQNIIIFGLYNINNQKYDNKLCQAVHKEPHCRRRFGK